MCLLTSLAAFTIQAVYYGLQFQVFNSYTSDPAIQYYLLPSSVSVLLVSCLLFCFGLLYFRASITIPASQEGGEPANLEQRIKAQIRSISLIQFVALLASVILAICYPFVSESKLRNYNIGLFSLAIVLAVCGFAVLLMGLLRIKKHSNRPVDRGFLFTLHLVVLMAMIASWIYLVTTFASQNDKPRVFYHQPEDLGTFAIIYSVVCLGVMAFLFCRFWTVSKSDWHAHVVSSESSLKESYVDRNKYAMENESLT